jgi:FtsP/CotA-like multicopper oxidase with cupredoxin domain
MRRVRNYCVLLITCAGLCAGAAGQCPPRPSTPSVVNDAPSLYSKDGMLKADFTMGYSVDVYGYTHYCYKYVTGDQTIEAPTLRLNPGDRLLLHLTDDIPSSGPESHSSMDMASAPGGACGDGGTATLSSTNMHFHGLNVSPTCHQDDVLTTLIQPGTPGFQYDVHIPKNEPPGLYWYHPHVHGFTEFQVNGGAAGALIVEGMEKVRPEVAGLTERVFTIRQQFLVPWVPGPYQLTLNFEYAPPAEGPMPIIEMKTGERQFWRVLNASLQDFMPLQVWFNNVPQPLEVIALDGYPLSKPQMQETITIPPAGRAEFIVSAPSSNVLGSFEVLNYSTGPTGNADFAQPLATIQLDKPNSPALPKHLTQTAAPQPAEELKFADLLSATATTNRKLYFSEEFGGTNGPIQFYVTVDGQKQQVFQANEKPVITTKVGAVEDWTIENRALETHAFHIHQIHFMLIEVDGKPVKDQELRDTIEIPYWSGKGPYHSVKVRMDFRDPTIAGTFVFHCHILLHEDMGMMHKILVEP